MAAAERMAPSESKSEFLSEHKRKINGPEDNSVSNELVQFGSGF